MAGIRSLRVDSSADEIVIGNLRQVTVQGSSPMKVFGRLLRHCSSDGLAELSEATFVASPEMLRKVAAFLVQAADQSQRAGASYGHSHIQDEIEGWKEQDPAWPDIIVSA